MNNIKTVLFTCLLFNIFSVRAQNRFSLAANYGLNGSFFSASLDNNDGPSGIVTFNEKNFIGQAGGIEGRLILNAKSHLSLGFTHSENKKEYVYDMMPGNIRVNIYYFTIRHLENIFHLGYNRQIFRKHPSFRGEIGLFYSRMIDQSIDIITNAILISEAKFNPGRFNELGAYVGLQFAWKIDTKFDLGIQTRAFYEITSVTFSQITLAPTLTYHFQKSKRKSKVNP